MNNLGIEQRKGLEKNNNSRMNVGRNRGSTMDARGSQYNLLANNISATSSTAGLEKRIIKGGNSIMGKHG